jgi:hypothetical protein
MGAGAVDGGPEGGVGCVDEGDSWMTLQRYGVLIVVVIAVTAFGCAGLRPVRPTGPMWGFFTDSTKLIAPRANTWLGQGSVVYAKSESACREARANVDGRTPCLNLLVAPGTGHYALVLPSHVPVNAFTPDSLPGGITIATPSRERCEAIRSAFMTIYSVMGDCQPTSVERLQ